MMLKYWLLIFFSFVFISLFSQNDSFNKVDENNLKQGYWVSYYFGNKIKEEGKYVDNKKEGIWKSYYKSGQIKSEITYVKNRPNGFAKFYYENGNVSEEGIWKINKWIGDYKMYHKNGNVSYDWHYSENGKRTGEQKYYHPNGKIMIEGKWENGKEQGIIKQYDEKGNLVSERTFNDGKQDPNSIKYYNTMKNSNTEVKPIAKEIKSKENISTQYVGYFDGTGDNRIYDSHKRLWKEGYFEKGRLKNGKRYYYDSENKLTKTVEYKNFKIVNVKYED